ncbi:MAG TPA: hypothetical protein VGE04_15265 [Chloroflexia bacterium]|jgi:hypothetical protein
MSNADNLELQAPTAVAREVLVAVQNSSGLELDVTTFALTNGYWDPSAPNGVPTQGAAITPGQTATWGNYTSTPFTGVTGTMTINSTGVGTVILNWSWAYGGTPTATATITVAGIKAVVSLANTGSSTVTATYSISAS